MAKSLFEKLEGLHINTRSKHFAISDIKSRGWTPSRIREILADLAGKPADHVTDIEAEKTLMYLVGQILDPLGEVDLDEAHFSALALFEQYPHILAEKNPELDENGNLVERVERNEDGVAVGKSGKPRRGYKKAAALDLWRDNPKELDRDDRKAWIALFVEEISDMNPGTANTYLNNIERGVWQV